MNTKDKKSTLGFNLLVDRDLSDLFTVFANLFKDSELMTAQDDMAIKWRNTFIKFVETIVKPVHENGWCVDPECEDNSKDK